MLKLKNIASSQAKDEYYHSRIDRSLPSFKQQRTKEALKEFKRKKSLVNLKSQSVLNNFECSLTKEEEIKEKY